MDMLIMVGLKNNIINNLKYIIIYNKMYSIKQLRQLASYHNVDIDTITKFLTKKVL